MGFTNPKLPPFKPYPVREFVDDLSAWLADADKGINSPKLTDAQKIQFVRDIHNRCRGLLREFIMAEIYGKE